MLLTCGDVRLTNHARDSAGCTTKAWRRAYMDSVPGFFTSRCQSWGSPESERNLFEIDGDTNIEAPL